MSKNFPCRTCGMILTEGTEQCPNCGREQAAGKVARDPVSLERHGLGVLGALAAAVLGVAAVLLMGVLGLSTAVGAGIMGLLIPLGYRIFSGRMSLFGTLYCAVLLVMFPFIADMMDWALLALASGQGDSILSALTALPRLLMSGSIDPIGYLAGLGNCYLAALAAGVVGTVVGFVWRKR